MTLLPLHLVVNWPVFTILFIYDHTNEVTLRRARLLLRWVTACGYPVLVGN